jgi:hypothetical protein
MIIGKDGYIKGWNANYVSLPAKLESSRSVWEFELVDLGFLEHHFILCHFGPLVLPSS